MPKKFTPAQRHRQLLREFNAWQKKNVMRARFAIKPEKPVGIPKTSEEFVSRHGIPIDEIVSRAQIWQMATEIMNEMRPRSVALLITDEAIDALRHYYTTLAIELMDAAIRHRNSRRLNGSMSTVMKPHDIYWAALAITNDPSLKHIIEGLIDDSTRAAEPGVDFARTDADREREKREREEREAEIRRNMIC